MIHDMLIQLFGWVGLILASPMLYKMSYLLVMQVCRVVWKTREVTIKHFHDGKQVSSVTLKLDINEPLIRQINRIKSVQTEPSLKGRYS